MAQAAQRRVCKVQGTVTTTAYNMNLELQVLELEEKMEFKGVASGIFTAGSVPLTNARMRCNDWDQLAAADGSATFFIEFRATHLYVRFYSSNDPARLLGELRADAVAPAGNPSHGVGTWSASF